ncbi:MAG: CvpA family protein [Rubrivivax sp.]|nr:CvpA family protein [Rubrivivax sp.]
MLAILGLSMLIGIWRGLVYELMSLAGWVVAYIAALAFAPQVGPYLPIGEPGSSLNQAAAVAATFVMTLIVWGLLARLVRMLVAATPLTVPDRLLGAGFGFLRGLLLLMVLATVLALTPAAQSPSWQQSRGAQWLGVAIEGLRPALPESVARWLPQRRKS